MKARFFLLGLLIFTILFCIGFVYWRYSYRFQQKLIFSSVPNLGIKKTDKQLVDLKIEAANRTSVLIYYNSTCLICQSEAELIREQFAKDSLTQFLWVSSEPLEEVRLFSVGFGLDTLSTHSFYSDTLFTLASRFKLTGVPATFVYDAKGDLVDYYTSAVGMTELKKTIQEAHGRSR